MSKRTHRVTVDGKTYTRNSDRHTYTHVVIGRCTEQGERELREAGNGALAETRGVLQWSKSAANAEKGARTYRGYGFRDVEVVPVDGAEVGA